MSCHAVCRLWLVPATSINRQKISFVDVVPDSNDRTEDLINRTNKTIERRRIVGRNTLQFLCIIVSRTTIAITRHLRPPSQTGRPSHYVLNLSVRPSVHLLQYHVNTIYKPILMPKLNGTPIAKVNNCRYLGLYIENNLNWTYHINYIYSKKYVLSNSESVQCNFFIFIAPRVRASESSKQNSLADTHRNSNVTDKLRLMMMHMHKRGICRHEVSVCPSVCVFVCVSDTFVSCAKTNKDIFEIF